MLVYSCAMALSDGDMRDSHRNMPLQCLGSIVRVPIDMQCICRLDKTLLLDMVGDAACNMTGGPVCNGQVHNHGTTCMGRLKTGLNQLHPSSHSEQHTWIRQVHDMGMAVHAWTIRNEVWPKY
jgi:hypothetical protein